LLFITQKNKIKKETVPGYFCEFYPKGCVFSASDSLNRSSLKKKKISLKKDLLNISSHRQRPVNVPSILSFPFTVVDKPYIFCADIETYRIDTELSKVTVTGNVTTEEVVRVLQKIGKTATPWEET